jgi:hypothetical protein
VRNPDGYFVTTDPDPRRGQHRVKEADTKGCLHCGGHFFVKPMCDPADAGGFCHMCGTAICPRCAQRSECTHFERRMAQEEAKARFRRQF